MAESAALQDPKVRIAAAALTLFTERGFDAVSVTEIARHADVAQPSIHYYFKTKRALWEAAMFELAGRLERASAPVRSMVAAIDCLSALKAACSVLIDRAADTPELGRVILAEGQAGGDRLDWLMRNVFSGMYYEFLELVEKCVDEGHIKPYPPYQILMLLHGAAVTNFNVAPMVSAVFGEDPQSEANVAAYRTMYLDVIFAGLALPASKPKKAKSGKARD
ncbi:Transcriptional regulator, TetR family [Candidatus Phaeomarinobacter ectocarpi]|uniref:Transcriptional regulator, TetR family n=1 Tax=Candidatus Phaeomarinibacter ectocarpi TaxID=1458461 RepID=X5MDT9_9HYPH|nr:TetR/AcrR family transcriptional regulator [Candidatus Phaeomarinobacter ectocarpi]CDO58759.1 Transcriptional regulator, TetR family [Candidatus Phaeomarinobacter ectocarpi]